VSKKIPKGKRGEGSGEKAQESLRENRKLWGKIDELGVGGAGRPRNEAKREVGGA